LKVAASLPAGATLPVVGAEATTTGGAHTEIRWRETRRAGRAGILLKKLLAGLLAMSA